MMQADLDFENGVRNIKRIGGGFHSLFHTVDQQQSKKDLGRAQWQCEKFLQIVIILFMLKNIINLQICYDITFTISLAKNHETHPSTIVQPAPYLQYCFPCISLLGSYIITLIQTKMEQMGQPDALNDSSATQYAQLSLKGESQIAKNLCNLIGNETSLQLNHIHPQINDRLRSTYQEIMIQLQVDLRRMEKLKLEDAVEGEHITTLQGKIQDHIAKIVKLKEINIYFGHLNKQSSSLQHDVEKFLFYEPRSVKLEDKLQSFFSSPLVSELFLKEYQKSFNLNNFSADLIDFFSFLHSNGLLSLPATQTYHSVRNKDLVLIQNTNLIFRQICDINDKYAHVQYQLQDAYVHLRWIKAEKEEEEGKDRFKIEEEIIQDKFHSLRTIFQKIKSIYGGIQFNNLDNRLETKLLPEEPEVFGRLNQSFEYHCSNRNEEFLAFLQSLYNPSLASGVQQPGKVPHFDFLRSKIIRAETRWHLNRLLSAFNMGSHVVNQLQSSLLLTHHSFTFSDPWRLSKYQFNFSRAPFYSSQIASLAELTFLNRNTLVARHDQSYILRMDKDKVIYPSAVNNYFYFLKYLYLLSSILQARGVYNQELMLELIEIRADEMMEWAEIASNLFQLIKGKYFRCYELLQKYLQLIFHIAYEQELDYLQRNLKEGAEGVSFVLGQFIAKEKKAGCISQIIFQFQADYDIRESLLQLYSIQERQRGAFYCTDSPHFYQAILNEIIETKNNLKFDRCLSFNSLHQLFGFIAARPNDLKDLAAQLTPLSKHSLRLPDLLRFYAAQTKLKREVFKAQLYWITIAQNSVKNKFIINSQRKKVSFRDFLDENAKSILSLSDKPLSYFLTNLQEFERSVFLLGQEVERLKLIQASLLYLKPDFPLEDHLSAFSHKQLVTFFNYCSHFNLVEDLYIRRDKKNWIISNIKKCMGNGKLKFSDLGLESALVTLKEQLANYIFFLYSFEHHYSYDDCVKLIKRVIKDSQPPQYALKLEILRSKRDLLKEYEEGQFMDAPSLGELTQIYELLVLVGVNRLLRSKKLQGKDEVLFKKIRRELPMYDCFKVVDILESLESVKAYSCTTSRSHTLCGLKAILSFYRQMRDKGRKYPGEWRAQENIGLMTEIGIVARRLFCNEIVQLKRIVSADEWRAYNKTTCLLNLKQELDKEFLTHVNLFIANNLQGIPQLDISLPLSENITVMDELFKKQIYLQYDEKYSLEVVKKQPIVLFDQFRGYQVEFHSIDEEDPPQVKRNYKKNRTNYKRGLLNTMKREDHGSTQIINDLQHRINLQIVKESLPIRKLIYQLQLQQKRIRDEISWETCKLQHNVISKINKFIEESNLDQKQSLINFKYTVNLETIKGIENVIHERTEIFHKNSLEKLNDSQSNGFLTEPKPYEPKSEQTQEQSLLDHNVRNIFNHVKMLKTFWAWKNIHMQKHSNQDEWVKFSENVEKILHNSENIKRMGNLQELRENCNRHEIVCNLIREENVLLNNSIKKMKVSTLSKKLNSFKEKHKVEESRGDR